MQKGLFWVTNESDGRRLITYAAECNANGTFLGDHPPFNSRKGDSFSHKESWESAAKDCPREIRNKSWDHYPRGCVEIKSGKVTVYHNLALTQWPDFEATILQEFKLVNFPVKFMPDHSNHYQSYTSGPL